MRRLLMGLVVLVCLCNGVENCRADDPCEGMDDILLKAVSVMPKLSADEFRHGQFAVTSAGKGHSIIKYTVRGKVRFKLKVEDLNNYKAIKIGGLSSLSVISREEGSSCCYCGYLVAPSYNSGRLMVIPSRPVILRVGPSWYNGLPLGRAKYYQDKNELFRKFLYQPVLNGRPMEYLEHIDVEDFDGDGQLEIFSIERPSWADNCNYSNAGRPRWKKIFHLLPEENRLEDVSASFPEIYAEIAKGLQNALEEDMSPQCVSKLTSMINKARQLAGQ